MIPVAESAVHALEFARRGFKVTGVDRTAPYLDAAAESADSENLDIEFVLQDVRSFSRPAAFDLAMNLFTSFGFFSSVEEEKQYITSIHTNLTGNGIFVIDVNGKETLARDFKTIGRVRKGRLYSQRRISD